MLSHQDWSYSLPLMPLVLLHTILLVFVSCFTVHAVLLYAGTDVPHLHTCCLQCFLTSADCLIEPQAQFLLTSNLLVIVCYSPQDWTVTLVSERWHLLELVWHYLAWLICMGRWEGGSQPKIDVNINQSFVVFQHPSFQLVLGLIFPYWSI